MYYIVCHDGQLSYNIATLISARQEPELPERNSSSVRCITCMYDACHGDQLSRSNVKQTIAVVLGPFLHVPLAMAHVPSLGLSDGFGEMIEIQNHFHEH